jgi:glycosyltransferase involved in cell wall biosynthesis
MNVLLVTFEPSGKIVGGLGIFSEAIHKELNAVEGIEVKTLYLNPSLPSEEKCETVDYELFLGSEDEDFLKTEPYYNGLEKEYLTQLGDFQPDVIHLNDRQTCLPFLVNEKSVFSLHLPFALSLGYNPMNVSPEISEIFDLERSICQSGVPVIVYSDFMQREVHSKITINSSPMKLLLGIDQDKFYSGEKKKLICFVGRFSETHKGFLTFLRAISMINAFLEEKGYTVELYGRGNVDGIELPSSIVHSGFLDEAEKIKKLAETEIVVMPSRYEPFGYVGLEAISSGCTLITTKGMGQEEYANDSNALFIDQIHPVDLATKIVQAVVNPKAKNDHPECKSIFTIQEFVKMHVEIYQEVMNGEIAFRQYFSSYPTLTFREEASKHDINFHIDELLSTFSEWELERAIFVSPFLFLKRCLMFAPGISMTKGTFSAARP